MKQKLTHPFFTILLCIIVSFLLTPVQRTTAQPEEDSDFLITLALMAVADDRLDGVMDLSALSNLRAEVDDYYTQKSYLQMDEETSSALKHQQQVILTSLDKKIQKQMTLTNRAQIALFVALSDSTSIKYLNESDSNDDPDNLFFSVLSSGYEPNPEAMAMLQQRLSASTQSTMQQNLDGQVAAGVPDGSNLINQSSESVYDFDAGQSQGAAGSQTVQPRPLNFSNTGSTTVQVSVEYYQPPEGLAVASPAMNVEVPGQESVVMMGFPQGNYVFCVDWETDYDTNGDGHKDYDRSIFHGWVSTSHPEDPQQAQVIRIGASYSETPTGRCGGFLGEAPRIEETMREVAMTEDDSQYNVVEPTEEQPDDGYESTPQGDSDGGSSGGDFWDQGEGTHDNQSTGYTLTSQEKANEGYHSYEVICIEDGKSMEETEYIFVTFQFTDAGVNVSNLQGQGFYPRSGANYYALEDGSRILFSSTGFSSKIWVNTETSSEGVVTKTYRNCRALFRD